MTWYISSRFLVTIPVAAGVSLAVFSMLFLIPGDPVKMMLSEFATSPEQIARMRAQLHLNEPFAQQYGRFIWGPNPSWISGETPCDNKPREISPALSKTATPRGEHRFCVVTGGAQLDAGQSSGCASATSGGHTIGFRSSCHCTMTIL